MTRELSDTCRIVAKSRGLARWAVVLVAQECEDRPGWEEMDPTTVLIDMQPARLGYLMGVSRTQASLALTKAVSTGDLDPFKVLDPDNLPRVLYSLSMNLLFSAHMHKLASAKAVLLAENVRTGG